MKTLSNTRPYVRTLINCVGFEAGDSKATVFERIQNQTYRVDITKVRYCDKCGLLSVENEADSTICDHCNPLSTAKQAIESDKDYQVLLYTLANQLADLEIKLNGVLFTTGKILDGTGTGIMPNSSIKE